MLSTAPRTLSLEKHHAAIMNPSQLNEIFTLLTGSSASNRNKHDPINQMGSQLFGQLKPEANRILRQAKQIMDAKKTGNKSPGPQMLRRFKSDLEKLHKNITFASRSFVKEINARNAIALRSLRQNKGNMDMSNLLDNSLSVNQLMKSTVQRLQLVFEFVYCEIFGCEYATEATDEANADKDRDGGDGEDGGDEYEFDSDEADYEE